jgi:hypothetical protein
VVLLGEVLKLRWRGPTPLSVSRWGERGTCMSSSHQQAATVTVTRGAGPARAREGLCGVAAIDPQHFKALVPGLITNLEQVLPQT